MGSLAQDLQGSFTVLGDDLAPPLQPLQARSGRTAGWRVRLPPAAPPSAGLRSPAVSSRMDWFLPVSSHSGGYIIVRWTPEAVASCPLGIFLAGRGSATRVDSTLAQSSGWARFQSSNPPRQARHPRSAGSCVRPRAATGARLPATAPVEAGAADLEDGFGEVPTQARLHGLAPGGVGAILRPPRHHPLLEVLAVQIVEDRFPIAPVPEHLQGPASPAGPAARRPRAGGPEVPGTRMGLGDARDSPPR